jgi:hypothetical protein
LATFWVIRLFISFLSWILQRLSYFQVRCTKEHVDISFNALAYDAATHNGHNVPDVLTIKKKVAQIREIREAQSSLAEYCSKPSSRY